VLIGETGDQLTHTTRGDIIVFVIDKAGGATARD
jgi:hypothetical protein